MSKILGTYKITYDGGVTQFKDLISQEDYDNILKPLKQSIQELEGIKNTDKAFPAAQKTIKENKRQIFEMFGDNYFTSESPLFYAIETGILKLPIHQGGEHKCTLIKQ